MYGKILVAVDGSDTSLLGLNEAIRIAKAMGSSLLLVHVANPLVLTADPAFSAAYVDTLLQALRESGRKILTEAGSLVRRADVPCEQKLLESFGGRVADEIVAQARAWPADLIVLGTHGRRGLARLAMGSDAELVLRMSPVPVLMVRDQSQTG